MHTHTNTKPDEEKLLKQEGREVEATVSRYLVQLFARTCHQYVWGAAPWCDTSLTAGTSSLALWGFVQLVLSHDHRCEGGT